MNILEELKLSKKQNNDKRYDYLCKQFNVVDYAMKLEKYTIKLQQESKKQKEVIDKAIEFTNKNWGTWCTHHLEYMTELQDILQGSDNQ